MPAISDRIDLAKTVLFAGLILPALLLPWHWVSGGMGAEPIRATIHYTGIWTLRALILALAVSPVFHLTGWGWIMRQRRMVGLFAFFYATLHMMSYVGLDHFFDWPLIWEDVVKRPFITLGMTAFIILLVLAVTSPRAVARRMGGRRWRLLHRLVYVAALAGGVHFLIGVKAGIGEPGVYLAIIAALVALRLVPPRTLGLIRKRRSAV
ncbi:MAG: protein-methionine-sulfoxide reductase heme-binding subunit MsrQ [Sphingomonadales bacterium]